MNYNHLYSSFDYYCKKSNIIEFSYLDVVSRMYVVKNNCKNIYIDKCENCDYGLINDIIDEDNDTNNNTNDTNATNTNNNDEDDDDTYMDIDTDADDDIKEASADDVIKKKESSIFYNKSNNKVKSQESNDYVSNKYKYKGTIEEFYSYCETNNYRIHYCDLLENNDTNYSITFSIDKEEEPLMTKTMEYNASNKNDIGFKEFKKFQKF